MEDFLNTPIADEYELIESNVGTATMAVPVDCAKCGEHLFTASLPIKKPACPRCWVLIQELKVAMSEGFRVGF